MEVERPPGAVVGRAGPGVERERCERPQRKEGWVLCWPSYAACWNLRLRADLGNSEKLLIAKRYIVLFLNAYCFHAWSFDLFLKTFHCPPAMEKSSVTPSKLETGTVAAPLARAPPPPPGGMTNQGFVSWRPAILPPRSDWEVLADPLVPPAHSRAGCVRRCQALGLMTV